MHFFNLLINNHLDESNFKIKTINLMGLFLFNLNYHFKIHFRSTWN